MKIFWATILCLAMLLSPAGFISGPAAAAHGATSACCAQKHACCKAMPCCLAKNDSSAPAKTPAAPSSTLNHTDWQMVSALLLILPPPASHDAPAAHPDFTHHPGFASPLYQRNCSYLI